MKKLSYLFSALAVTAMVGCSSDDVVQQQTAQALQTTRAITFSPMTKGATTRSQVYQTTADMTSFKVMALWENDFNAGQKIYIAGIEKTLENAVTAYTPYTDQFGNTGIQEVNYSSAGWNFRDGTTRYWPYTATTVTETVEGQQVNKITGYNCATLAFRAISPISYPDAYSDAESFMQEGDQLTGNYHFNMTRGEGDTWDHNNTPVSVADMRDICFAQKTSANSSKAVELVFRHAFTQVVFKAKKTSNYQVDIKSIQIGGVKFSGEMRFNNFEVKDFWRGGTGSLTTSYPGFASTTPISLSSAADEAPVQLTEKGQELLLIPQQINPWVPTSGIKATESNLGYIAVTFRYRLSNSSQWITGPGTTDGYETTYFPLTAEWGKGQKFNYTLLFGGADDNGDGEDPGSTNPDPGNGYDEDGKPKAPSVAITFNPTVSDWEEYKVDITE